MPEKQSPLVFLWAFLVGGCLGVVAELIFRLLLLIGCPADAVIVAMLAVVAFLGMLTTYLGLYDKLAFAGFGSILPFCGMTNFMTNIVAGSLAEGKSLRQACWAGVKIPTLVFAFSIPLAVVLALIFG